ncbi:MAG: acyl dehydratase, partial [Caulobacter sp.]
MPAAFDDIEIGQVVSLGTRAVDAKALDAFISAFTPGWPVENGAPDGMIFAI